MVEVRRLTHDEEPNGQSWVLIEKRGDLYFITGRQNGASMDASVSPTGFDTPEAAIRAATSWADLLSAPFLYVRDHVDDP